MCVSFLKKIIINIQGKKKLKMKISQNSKCEGEKEKYPGYMEVRYPQAQGLRIGKQNRESYKTTFQILTIIIQHCLPPHLVGFSMHSLSLRTHTPHPLPFPPFALFFLPFLTQLLYYLDYAFDLCHVFLYLKPLFFLCIPIQHQQILPLRN